MSDIRKNQTLVKADFSPAGQVHPGERGGGQSELLHRDFPGGSVIKNPPANAGDTGSSPGLGGFHMPRSS